MSKFLLQHAMPNPTLEYAESIIVPEGTTEIVSQGGGSTIDVGKWLARKYDLHHTAIPTTCGTGSEVTRYCVLMVDGKKKTYDLDIPTSYVLDSRLLESLPNSVLISSALDALSQGFESQWSIHASPESINYAQMAINMVLSNLHLAKKFHTEPRYRMNLLIGANMSGRAIDMTRTNVCHAISYPLTEWYGIPHGIACAMSLTYFVKKFLGIDLAGFMRELDLPKYKIDAKKVAKEVIKSPKLKDCPVEITIKDIVDSLTT